MASTLAEDPTVLVAVGPGGVLRDGDAVVVGVGEMLCAVGGTLPPAWRGAA